MGPTRPRDDAPFVLADRLTAAAWRLAGARVVELPDAVSARELRSAFADACAAGTAAVLLTRALAARLPAAELARRRRGSTPLVGIVESASAEAATVAGAAATAEVPDVVAHARRVLGVAP